MLRAIDLRDFKSFQSAHIDMGALTLIVGANASGKSNCRDALRLLHGVGLGYTLAEVMGGKFGPGGIEQWRGIRGGPREMPFGNGPRLTVAATVQAMAGRNRPQLFHYRLTVDVTNERLGPRVVAESLHRGPHYLYDSNPTDDPVAQHGEHEIRVRQPRGGNHRKHGPVLAFPSHTPVLSQFPHRAKDEAGTSLKAACNAVLDVLQSFRFLDLDPDAMRQSSPPGVTILGDRGENLSSVLYAICDDEVRKEQLLQWVRNLTPMDAVDFDFRYDLQGRVLMYLEEANGQQISAVSASDGTLRFLALVAALLSPDSGQLYFFEEFDNGIHPTRLHLLLELVQQACRDQDIQVVGTTHNPALLAFLEPDDRAHAVLAYRTEDRPDSRLVRILDLPDVERVLETQDLGRLHASGWLEDAAAFGASDEEG